MLRKAALFVIRVSGALRLWRYLHRGQITIVSIHGVMDDQDKPAWTPLRQQIPRQVFAEQVSALSKYYRFVSLQDAVEMLTCRKPMAPNSLVFTFDDGYRNNLTHALPVLRRHHAPATIFLATGHVEERRPFWFDRLDYALQHAVTEERSVRIAGQSICVSNRDRASLEGSYRRLRDAAKNAVRDDERMRVELDTLAAELESEYGRRLEDILETDDWSGLVTWRQAADAQSDGITFGSHTVDHVRLALVDRAIARDQLERSRAMIEQHTGRPCRHLAYPNGSFDAGVADLARECGYTCAVTTLEGGNRPGDDLLTLRRIALPQTCHPTELLMRVSGLWGALLRLKRRFGVARKPARDVAPAREPEWEPACVAGQ